MGAKRIARELGVDRKTVKRWLRRGAWQLVLDFLDGREGLRDLARKHCVSRSLIREWIQQYQCGQVTDDLDPIRIADYLGKIAELERNVGQVTMESIS